MPVRPATSRLGGEVEDVRAMAIPAFQSVSRKMYWGAVARVLLVMTYFRGRGRWRSSNQICLLLSNAFEELPSGVLECRVIGTRGSWMVSSAITWPWATWTARPEGIAWVF